MEYIYKPNLARRILATLIDYFLFGSFCLVYVFGKEEANSSYAVRNLMVLPIIGMWFFYYVFIEGRFGNTIGHSLLQRLEDLATKVIVIDRIDRDQSQPFAKMQQIKHYEIVPAEER